MPSEREHNPPAAGRALWLDTLGGVLQPRRLAPLLVLALPLMASQHAYSAYPLAADAIAAGMVVGFVLLGPFAWRALFGAAAPSLPWVVRLALFAIVGVMPLTWGYGMTAAVELGPSFLVSSLNGGVAAALFLVGGWGLGRDIELERGLEAERARADALRKQAEAAELLAIRAHLDPHFLFNTLNAIAEWCTLDGAKAEEAILTLSGVLRQVMTGIRAERWPLDEELRIVRDVLALHQIRDPAWFDVDWRAQGHGASIPPLLLLPLVENAVKHGPAKGHRGTIRVATALEGGRLTVEIANPGPYGGPRDGGEGLRMVRDRLALAFGDRASLLLEGQGDATVARVGYDVPSGGE
ncbi:MAG: histidine kinase [Alphaproteobacteria bacterium]|nr:histidine kinase [Alphaproteobacteria bacterium]